MSADTRGSKYFLFISLALLALVFLGFAPTFYLRPLFGRVDDPTGSTSLPTHLILHGLALTSWYVLFGVQTALISIHKTPLHRRLGIAGVISGLAVITSGVVVLTRVVPRRIQGDVLPPPVLLELFRDVALSQTFNLTFFAACVAAAIYFRKKPEVHKRLMLTASVLVIGAALSTNRSFGAAVQSLLPDFLAIGYTTVALIMASLFVFDIVNFRKVFATTIFGAVLLLLIRPLYMHFVLHSQLGIQWTNWLGGIPS